MRSHEQIVGGSYFVGNSATESTLKSCRKNTGYLLIVSVANLPKFTISGVNQLEKWTFNDKIPNSFVRLENYEDDIRKINFINEEFIDSSQIKLKEQRTFEFNEMYSAESAKKIYHFFKRHFYLCGYDPFSFTKEKLTDKEKISFIHDIL
jgi:hypothetical protein